MNLSWSYNWIFTLWEALKNHNYLAPSNLTWAIPLFIFLIIFVRVKARGFFWETRDGEEIDFKEFRIRFLKGVEGITALQQSISNLWGSWITISGVLFGIVTMAVIRIPHIWWWTEICLVGGLLLTIIQTIGFYQKYKSQKRVEETMKKIEEESIKEQIKQELLAKEAKVE